MTRLIGLAILVSLLIQPTRASELHQLGLISDVPVGDGRYFHHNLPVEGIVNPKNVARKFDAADGFPEAIVRSFALQTNGVIWLASDVGLYCFDGCRVKHFDTGDLQLGQSVAVVETRGEVEVWFGARNGLALLLPLRKQIQYFESFQGEEIYSLASSVDDEILVGTGDGLYAGERGQFEKVGESLGATLQVQAIERDVVRNGTWVGTTSGLFWLVGRNLTRSQAFEPSEEVCALHVDRNGQLWIGTDSRLLRLREGRVDVIYENSEAHHRWIRAFVEHENGEMWIAAQTASFRVPVGEAASDAPMFDYFPRKLPIRAELIDRNGHRWFSLEQSDLTCVYSDRILYTSSETTKVLKASDGTLWFGTNEKKKQDYKLARLQNGRFSTWPMPSYPSCLIEYQGKILVGTAKDGLFFFDENGLVPYPVEVLQDAKVHDLVVDHSETLWVAMERGLYRVSGSEITESWPTSENDEVVHRVFSNARELVVATKSKVRRYDRNHKLTETLDFSKGLSGKTILDVLVTSDGQLWVGSTVGLFRQLALGHPLEPLGEHSYLAGSFLVDTGDGRIWAGAKFGLCRVDVESGLIQHLLTDEGVGKVWHCCADGDHTWIGGNEGLFRYQNDTQNPGLSIDRITADRELGFVDQVKMTSDVDLLSVELHSISTGKRNGSSIYRYRMRGLSDGWNHTRDTRLEFHNLPSGKYELEMQVYDQNLTKSEVVTLPVHVSYPLARYATCFLVAMLLCFVGGGLAINLLQRKHAGILERQVNIAVEERMRLEEELRRASKLESLGTLAAGMAHDFNNVLQVIYVSGELALLSEDREEYEEHVANIQTASDQARNLTSSILTFAGRGKNKVEPADMVSIVSNCIRMMRRTFPRSIDFQIDLPLDKQIWCEIDTGQMKQAIVNLCLNARDAMGKNGTLSIELSTVRNDGQKSAELIVADSGCGISKDNLESIFEPFFTTKARGEGTGLGLSITHGIIKAHEGSIRVDSEQGHGTRFAIRLPCCAALDESEGESTSRALRAIRDLHPRVLVADDRRAVRDSLRSTLEAHGCEVTLATNGAQTLDLAFSSLPEIIVLDIDMPVLDGLSVLNRLRESGNAARVVLITGAPNPTTDSHENIVVLRKPFSTKTLIEAAFPTV